MAYVVNRADPRIEHPFAHTPDFPVALWLINPVVPNCAPRYRKVVGDTLVEMTSEEKAVADVPVPVERPADLVEAYAAFAAAWSATGLPVPVDDELASADLHAIADVKAWALAGADADEVAARLAAGNELTHLRSLMTRRGGPHTWADFLAWAAEQQA